MKKAFCILICLSVILLFISGCQNSIKKATKSSAESNIEKLLGEKIENLRKVQIKYGLNNNTALILEDREIKIIEDLLNNAEFYESDKGISGPLLYIDFYGEKDKKHISIGDNNVISSENIKIFQSKDMIFEQLLSILREKVEGTGEEKIEKLIGEKMKNSLRITIESDNDGKTAHIKDKNKIEELGDLFNTTKFSKSISNIESPQLCISFYTKEDVTRFYVGKNDIIRLMDYRNIESKEINYEKILSIYNENISNAEDGKSENSSEVKIEDLLGHKIKVTLDSKIENTTKLEMIYDAHSNFLKLFTEDEIKELEDLFNNAEFYKTYKPRYNIGIRIIFYGENGTNNFYIDEDDYIKLSNDRYVKSDQISFQKLFSIYQEVLLRK
ncbi:hypothetical protein [Sporosalibacterium faouarense]|uniref:hypothetical protein n=1 Tax=Sporosalibacterium faouarense TaxID=516123 RepID=UPI00192AAC76|nr:hypothetical protein [Sporosalibacterium faouarense]